jgi:hypothetical protein
MENQIPPICQAIVLCDGLHQSPSTRRISLLETIGNILKANDFPQSWSPIVAYFILTNGRGRADLTLRWTDPDDEPLPGSEQHHEIEFGDPLETYEVFFYCDGLVFPEPGEYRIELLIADKIVADRRIFVLP